MSDPKDFPPFREFAANASRTTQDAQAAQFALLLALNMAVDPAQIANEPQVSNAALKASSFTKADFEAGAVERLFGWVSFQEYASLYHMNLSDVEEHAGNGLLGRVETDPTTNCKVVIWPTEMQDSDEVKELRIGESRWAAQIKQHARVETTIEFSENTPESFETSRRQLIYLIRRLGDAQSVCDAALASLYRTSFLSLWSYFESFIRDALCALLQKFPEALALLPHSKNASLSLRDILALSSNLSDIASLRTSLINAELSKLDTKLSNVGHQLSLFNTLFAWPNGNAFIRQYTECGMHLNTSMSDVHGIKEIRNGLIHRQKITYTSFAGGSRLLKTDEGFVLGEHFLVWTELVLRSIAHGIAEDFGEGKINVQKYSPK